MELNNEKDQTIANLRRDHARLSQLDASQTARISELERLLTASEQERKEGRKGSRSQLRR